jgi:hypothetical protein
MHGEEATEDLLLVIHYYSSREKLPKDYGHHTYKEPQHRFLP